MTLEGGKVKRMRVFLGPEFFAKPDGSYIGVPHIRRRSLCMKANIKRKGQRIHIHQTVTRLLLRQTQGNVSREDTKLVDRKPPAGSLRTGKKDSPQEHKKTA